MSLLKSRFIELIGNIQNPKYQLVELNEICEFIKDGTHQTPIYTEDRVNGFKFLSSKDVTSQKINWSNIKYIPKELHEQLYAKLSPKRGDILLAKNGTTGVAAVVDSDEIFDIYVSLALLRPKSGVNVSYLCSALNSEDLKRQFNSSLKGIGVPNLHLREIKKARIIFPPIDIQNKISSITKQIDKSKFLLQQILEKFELLKKSRFIEMFGDVINNKKTWPTKRWSYVLNIVNGKNQKKVECENGIYPICGSGGKIGKTNEYLTKENSVIIGRKGNINNPILMKTKFWNVDTAFGLEPNNKDINVEYLYKFCELFDFQRLNKTVTIPSLTKSDLLKIEIPVPPMKLQEEYRNFLAQVDKSKLIIQKALEDLVGKV